MSALLHTQTLTVKKRDGRLVPFFEIRILKALEAAFKAHLGVPYESELKEEWKTRAREVAGEVVRWCEEQALTSPVLFIEDIQNAVVRQLRNAGLAEIAETYAKYRYERELKRCEAERLESEKRGRGEKRSEDIPPAAAPKKPFSVRLTDGALKMFNLEELKLSIAEICDGFQDHVSVEHILAKTLTGCYDGMEEHLIEKAALLGVRELIETEPAYNQAAARILLKKVYRDAANRPVSLKEMAEIYPKVFQNNIARAVKCERLSPDLERQFDLNRLGAALKPDRDFQFTYLGLQTLYDRYLIHDRGRRLETPQTFWMRVAMGLALNEGDEKNARAVEFYDLLSTFRFVASTPTLFNAGTLHAQLSSCFLTTVGDDLDHIFKCVKDNALLSKWSGGLGNDWTPVRAMGSHIKGTNGASQGVIPFLKVANDTAVAVNQGGKRQGAVCAYLEVWHLDIEEFLELRKNTGDDRRRAHDMHTAAWIPDLFMKRVLENGGWTLLSPNESPDLHDLCGRAFEKRYEEYEQAARAGKLNQHKSVSAVTLWRKMLSMLFETGHPWITFKDPSNIRSPQDHAGVVHSSNLCTEIMLNTSRDETAVCNLGSVNLAVHTTPAGLDRGMLAATVKTAVRMLDNVIDLNYYPTPEARNSNLRHRPVGLGLMGFQDALYIQGLSYASHEAVDFADESMEFISHHAILASSGLARERGAYESFRGSKWDRGILPIDSIELLLEERGGHLSIDKSSRMDWTPAREAVRKWGMRNSNLLAIAPTATIANITGVTQSIEPTYKNLYVKSNLSGEFTVINPYLVNELKALGLWDERMVADLKHFDGKLNEIDRIPQSVKNRYPTSFDIDYEWLIECASRRQKWIDMGESLNLYLAEPSGKKLHNMYFTAWEKGLKTTYYLRSLAATRIEKSTVDPNQYGDPIGKQKKDRDAIVKSQVPDAIPEGRACDLNSDGECEVCQ